MTTPSQPAYDIVARIQGLIDREDRGPLAEMRRGLGKTPGEAPGMFPHVEPTLAQDASLARRQATYLVASLMSLHQHHKDLEGRFAARSFGGSLRAIRDRDNGDADAGVEQRFKALLDCEREELPMHLRSLLKLLTSRAPETPVDYRQLLQDLERWDYEDRRVQRNWATGFWGFRPAASSQEEPSPHDNTEPPADGQE